MLLTIFSVAYITFQSIVLHDSMTNDRDVFNCYAPNLQTQRELELS